MISRFIEGELDGSGMTRMPTLSRGLLAALLFAISTCAIWLLWAIVLIAIGAATKSGPIGICGAYGPYGDLLFSMMLLGFFVAMALSLVVTRKLLGRFWPIAVQPQPAPPDVDVLP